MRSGWPKFFKKCDYAKKQILCIICKTTQQASLEDPGEGPAGTKPNGVRGIPASGRTKRGRRSPPPVPGYPGGVARP